MTRWRCRVCGQRLTYLRRTFTFRHILASDHAPAPVAEKVPVPSAYERREREREHAS